MNLELLKVNQTEIDSNTNELYQVYIDGLKVGHTFFRSGGKTTGFRLYLTEEDIPKIANYTLDKFDHRITEIAIDCTPDESLAFQIFEKLDLDIFLFNSRPLEESFASLEITLDTGNWVKPYNYNSFKSKFRNFCDNTAGFEFNDLDGIITDADFAVDYPLIHTNKTLPHILSDFYHKFKLLVDETVESLLIEERGHTLTSIFNFPEEIQAPCEQYLVYFSQFLEDLGIYASTTITKDAHRVLFTVTPEDSNQALSQIRDALNIYLYLPTQADSQLTQHGATDIGVHQLVANVYHLRSQVIMLQAAQQSHLATIRAQEAHIQSMNLTVYQQQNELNNIARKEESQESLFNGILTVKPVEAYGLQINTPLLLRMLKRKLKK